MFARGLSHAGVIFLRLGGYAPLALKIERLNDVLTNYADQLNESLVVTRTRVRVHRLGDAGEREER